MLSADLISGASAAAEYTGLSRRQIYHLVDAGFIPVKRMGSRLFFRKSELEMVFGAPTMGVN